MVLVVRATEGNCRLLLPRCEVNRCRCSYGKLLLFLLVLLLLLLLRLELEG